MPLSESEGASKPSHPRRSTSRRDERAYWETYSGLPAAWDDTSSKRLPEFLALVHEGPVLDLCCGKGRDMVPISEQFEVFGVDFSKTAIRKAENRLHRLVHAHLAVGDAERLPYADEVFGGVYSGYALERTDLEESAKEICRVLKPNGTAYLSLIIRKEFVAKPHKHPRDLDLDENEVVAIFGRHLQIPPDGRRVDKYREKHPLEGEYTNTRLVLIARKPETAPKHFDNL